MTEFLVEMEAHGLDALDPGTLASLRAAEAERGAELAADGVLVRLWRPAGQPLRNLGIWRARDRGALEAAIESLPMSGHLRYRVHELEPHPNDPASRG